MDKGKGVEMTTGRALTGQTAMTDIPSAVVKALVEYAVEQGLVDPADRTWAHNSVLAAVGESGLMPDVAYDRERGATGGDVRDASGCPWDGLPPAAALSEMLACLREVAARNGIPSALADDGGAAFSAHVMGVLTPRPSQVVAEFERSMRAGDSLGATRALHRLCVANDYIRTMDLARNLSWASPSRWGDLEITVNLSKPEKDPRAIAAAAGVSVAGSRDSGAPTAPPAPATPAEPAPAAPAALATPAGPAPSFAPATPYPACQLCLENEGYAGRLPGAPGGAHPARQNLRIVPIELGGERWGLQYSPYGYFDEHCIAMSPAHRPMHVDRENLGRLLDFVDLFPHYFVGSNADLPIVGGSILSHDHFQGGRHVFPMDRAPIDQAFEIPGFPEVTAGVLRWPVSVVRLTCPDRARLLDAAMRVVDAWRAYADPQVGIVSHTGDVRHNTVTPFAHKNADGAGGPVNAGGPVGAGAGGANACVDPATPVGAYRLDLALRCNVTSAEHPLGVFHPHAELHHIKRENIGLIEVMGQAILPGRLKRELETLARGIAQGWDRDALLADPLAAKHADWALDVAARHPNASGEPDVQAILRDEVGAVFARVLEDCGIFKWDEPGRAAQVRFLESL